MSLFALGKWWRLEILLFYFETTKDECIAFIKFPFNFPLCSFYKTALIYMSMRGLPKKNLKTHDILYHLFIYNKNGPSYISVSFACFFHLGLRGVFNTKMKMKKNVFTLRPSEMSLFLHQKCSIASLAHQWIICREWVPSEWEFKELIKPYNRFGRHC